MSEPKNIDDIPNWVIVNALKCPVESQISIVVKLLQHLDRNQRNQALSVVFSDRRCDCSDNKWHDKKIGGWVCSMCGLPV